MTRANNRHPRGRRLGGASKITPIVFAIGLLITLAYWQTRSAAGPDDPPTASPQATVGDGRPPLCRARQVHCGTVEVPDVGQVTYAIVAGQRDVGKKGEVDLIVDELGGPGLDVFARSDPSFLRLPASLRDDDVLLVRDLWGSASPGHDCVAAVNDYFGSDSAASTTPDALDACPSLGWTAQNYGAALARILAVEGRPLAGAIGDSYGALPAYTAAVTNPGAWLIVNAPITPGMTSGKSVVQDRARALDEALDRSYAASCGRLALDCDIRGSQLARDAAAQVRPSTVSGRSQTITARDAGLAVLSASYNLAVNGDWLWRTLSHMPHLSDAEWTQVGRFADQILERYGTGKISGQLGAYTIGLCVGYDRWGGGWDAPTSDPSWLLDRVAAACAARPSAAPGWPAPRPLTHGAACVYANRWDSVSPVSWGRSWARQLAIAPVSYSVEQHANLASAVSLGGRCQILMREG